jgi:hypothetical protein
MVKMRTGRAVIALLLAISLAPPVLAERAQYGSVMLVGLARDNWSSTGSSNAYAMVCNVNGPDGFLTVRSGPGTDFAKVRAFNRLSILQLDTSQRRWRWVRVVDGFRITTKDGAPQARKNLTVQGWAHDGYLCSFIY